MKVYEVIRDGQSCISDDIDWLFEEVQQQIDEYPDEYIEIRSLEMSQSELDKLEEFKGW